MIMKFTMAGKLVMQIGKSGASTGNRDTANVHQATDVFVDTEAREVYAADGYGNKRVIVFDSETGKFKRMWGAFGNPPPATFGPNVPTPQPQTTPDGPPEFGLPHAIKVSRDGVVYVADRINNRIQMFTRDGKYLKQVRVTNEGSDVAPVPAGFAFSPDPKQQFLYVVDSGPMRIVIFDRQTMTQVGRRGHEGKERGRVRHRAPHGGRLEGQSLHGGDRQQPARAEIRQAALRRCVDVRASHAQPTTTANQIPATDAAGLAIGLKKPIRIARPQMNDSRAIDASFRRDIARAATKQAAASVKKPMPPAARWINALVLIDVGTPNGVPGGKPSTGSVGKIAATIIPAPKQPISKPAARD